MRYLLLILLCFICNVFFANAQKPIQILQPKIEFDIKQATEMLNDGTAEIKGVSYYEQRTPIGIKREATSYARIGTIVTLYPLTAYLEEYLELKKKNKKGKVLAAISPLASAYRIETKVYSQTCEFSFRGLKPGKYYIESSYYFTAGTIAGDLSGIAEIKKDGEVLEYKLKRIN